MGDSTERGLVQYRCEERLAFIALDRPEKLNAMSHELVLELAKILKHFDQDAAADVAIIHGNGRAFSSGVDVKKGQLVGRDELESAGDPMGPGTPFSDLLTRSANWKPVIAAVHGYALGMSLGLALECDLIVAEEGARLQVTETSRGLGGYRHWALMQFRGARGFGDEVCLTGRYFTAEEAYAAGLINRLAPRGEVLKVARELAAEVAGNPPLSVRETVRVRRWHMMQFTQEVAFQTASLKLHLTEDFAEAAKAFAEKRKPGPFKGR